MNNELKQQIADEARIYMSAKKMSQAALARFCDVNSSYLSNIMSGNFEYRASGDKMVPIHDRYFEAIARKIGMSLVVTYWQTVETSQFIDVIATLEDAKKHGTAKMIIGDSGCGKTYAVNKFVEASPTNTFKITVSNMHKIHDVLNDLGTLLGSKLRTEHRKAPRMRAITEKLRDIYMQGGRPIVIIDEAENLTHGMIGLCKGLYDAINEHAALVLIGTTELEDKLARMERYAYSYAGIPQFRRRFKAGTVHLDAINTKTDFDAFLKGVQDPALCTLLRGICRNYGELHDFLEPALRSAAEDGVALTDTYFMTMYKLYA